LRTCKTQHGFTLIELLVVIAIIAVLAGVMFPVFASVRASGRKASCQSNLKQLYSTFMMYADDWDGTLPCPGGRIGGRSYWAQEKDGIEKYLKCQGLGLKSVYCCPSYTGDWREKRYSPRTYGMNSYLREPCDIEYPACLDVYKGIALTNIFTPAGTILLYEGNPSSGTGYDQSDPDSGYGEGYVPRCGEWGQVAGYYPYKQKAYQMSDSTWHRGRNNYLMCDGHILSRAPERYPGFRGPTSEANNMWYANKFRDGN
jgi:prepilin-type N-terminal cleavage/methylation domain-containing protein/prepilin-type processing-associated H-X9-DG protein